MPHNPQWASLERPRRPSKTAIQSDLLPDAHHETRLQAKSEKGTHQRFDFVTLMPKASMSRDKLQCYKYLGFGFVDSDVWLEVGDDLDDVNAGMRRLDHSQKTYVSVILSQSVCKGKRWGGQTLGLSGGQVLASLIRAKIRRVY